MPDLIAQGVEPQQRWRRPLTEGQEIAIGRLGGAWAVPWDHQVSRLHARLVWNGQRLLVEKTPEAKNPLFLHGRQEERFEIAPGDHFVVGQTTFTLADQQVDVSLDQPAPVQQQSFSAQYLKGVQFRNPDHRIEVLSRLPEVISGAAGEKELFVRLVSMLLAGVPRADAAAVVAVEERRGAGDEGRGKEARLAADGASAPSPLSSLPSPLVLHWDQRLAISGNFRPSRSLILESLRAGQSLLHVWRGAAAASADTYTISDAFDWAFCVPVPGKSVSGWGLYVAGRFNADQSGATPTSDPNDLREDVKFTELVAAMLGSLRQMRLLEHRHAALSQFFSPVVLESLAYEDPEVALAPRETEVSVMFCDLRGFSRESERHSGDLLGLLQQVSNALGVMTRRIREQGGVVGDFQGDAAMGFWGWPLPQSDAVLRTCRAALAVRSEFEAATGFRAGIGIATGPAVAGKIGTVDQVKVTVFGPVVNLASRLEGMTRIIQAPILLDETTARLVRRGVPREVARVRRLAVVLPFGLDTPLEISELLPPESEYPELTDEHLEIYEAALDAFLAGRWKESFELLHRIPAADQAKDFLVVHIARHNRRPPSDWDGVIQLASK
ncbi:MAG: adenylate/guanylate cyclase domain-containing protein [Pirellulales bacterium]|nr:adenylate/guanylate cyclase domain-containing protein [Pirellulales bacterium]